MKKKNLKLHKSLDGRKEDRWMEKKLWRFGIKKNHKRDDMRWKETDQKDRKRQDQEDSKSHSFWRLVDSMVLHSIVFGSMVPLDAYCPWELGQIATTVRRWMTHEGRSLITSADKKQQRRESCGPLPIGSTGLMKF